MISRIIGHYKFHLCVQQSTGYHPLPSPRLGRRPRQPPLPRPTGTPGRRHCRSPRELCLPLGRTLRRRPRALLLLLLRRTLGDALGATGLFAGLLVEERTDPGGYELGDVRSREG